MNSESTEKIANEIIKKLTDNYKNLTEGEFNYELIAGSIDNHAFDFLIETIENQIKFVNGIPDSKKRIEIMKKFFNKLESDKLSNFNDTEITKDEFINTKKIVQGSEIPFQNFKKYEKSVDLELSIDALCKMYAHAYERVCNLYFKPLANKITKKMINSCGACIDEIIKYDQATEFVLEPFIPQIRNSINHNNYYFDNKKNVLVFEDGKKTPINITLEQLRTACQLQIVSEVCIASAEFSLKLPTWKTSQYYFNKTEEFCRILQLHFKRLAVTCLTNGVNILQLHNVLEKMVKS